ncbi:MAG: ParB/RepB/Spo0J family partition protein [Lachnospiraceae bacterium]|nr:ParB/RepB/Spo0J family partition protein [Lachnospiraceae bacterium]
MAVKKGLGKGLDSLISNKIDHDIKKTVEEKKQDVSRETFLPLSKIEPNREQPRHHFDEAALKELADSIKVHGIIQPLVVRESGTQYEIIAGERRFRAAHLAGLKEVPVLIKNYSEQELYEIALIENLQREDLNAIEEAVAYKKLMEEYHLTQELVAERVSKSRVAITNALRLLKLDDRVQEMIIQKQLSAGHARALLSLEDGEQQYQLALEIQNQKLSVREVEKRVHALLHPPEPKEKKGNAAEDAIYAAYEEKLKSVMGTKVNIQRKDKNTGKIEIEYYSVEEFERLMQIFQVEG